MKVRSSNLTVGWNALCLVNKSKLIQQVLIVDYGKWYLLWKLIIYRKKGWTWLAYSASAVFGKQEAKTRKHNAERKANFSDNGKLWSANQR